MDSKDGSKSDEQMERNPMHLTNKNAPAWQNARQFPRFTKTMMPKRYRQKMHVGAAPASYLHDYVKKYAGTLVDRRHLFSSLSSDCRCLGAAAWHATALSLNLSPCLSLLNVFKLVFILLCLEKIGSLLDTRHRECNLQLFDHSCV